ncbi:uncharacterized protein LOC105771024 isoform X2 [Gossypium raimondii]|uniref:uncharacterized protein LOC105771024 isoform X2 n=1 Tax=Gossypium raimondii TaxID=29730 RepID=UPI00227B0F35|nr:uncharacterized protein LOC105771024 isoform X2 [Gossypium raimondii]
MATISAFSTPLHLISKTHFKSPKNLFFYPNSIHFQTKVSTFSSNNLTLSFKNSKTLYGTWKLKSAEEEEIAVVEQEREETTVAEQESVSVPVSPSDTLRMYFQADGMLNEAEILKVSVDILYCREKYSNGMVISSALIIWKGLICIIGSESPMVVVLSGSMEPDFKRETLIFTMTECCTHLVLVGCKKNTSWAELLERIP